MVTNQPSAKMKLFFNFAFNTMFAFTISSISGFGTFKCPNN